MVLNSHMVNDETRLEDLEFSYMRVRQNWKNRIGLSTVRPEKNIKDWSLVLHSNIADYVKLYQEMLNFQTLMVVAHRNLLSLYDTGSKGGWVDTIMLDQSHIRLLRIKKRPRHDRQNYNKIVRSDMCILEKKKSKYMTLQEKYELACLVGCQKFVFVKLITKANKTKFEPQFNTLDVGRRIIRAVNDKYYKFGLVVMTDTTPPETDFAEYLGCKVYTFPLAKTAFASYKLSLVKMRKLYDLVNSNDENEPKMIDYDSDFSLVNSNSVVFQADVENDFQAAGAHQSDDSREEADNDFMQHYGDKKRCVCLVINSKTINKIMPVAKVRKYPSK